MKKILFLFLLLPAVVWGQIGREGVDGPMTYRHWYAVDSAHVLFTCNGVVTDTAGFLPVSGTSNINLINTSVNLDSAGAYLVFIRVYSGGSVVDSVYGTYYNLPDTVNANVTNVNSGALLQITRSTWRYDAKSDTGITNHSTDSTTGYMLIIAGDTSLWADSLEMIQAINERIIAIFGGGVDGIPTASEIAEAVWRYNLVSDTFIHVGHDSSAGWYMVIAGDTSLFSDSANMITAIVEQLSALGISSLPTALQIAQAVHRYNLRNDTSQTTWKDTAQWSAGKYVWQAGGDTVGLADSTIFDRWVGANARRIAAYLGVPNDSSRIVFWPNDTTANKDSAVIWGWDPTDSTWSKSLSIVYVPGHTQSYQTDMYIKKH